MDLPESPRRNAVQVITGEPAPPTLDGTDGQTLRSRAAAWDRVAVAAHLLLAAVPVALVSVFLTLVLRLLS